MVKMKFYYLDIINKMIAFKNLEGFLDNFNKNFLVSSLTYILEELLSNAEKANLKRVFFIKKNLNINLLSDYEYGLEKFIPEVTNNKENYNITLKEKKFYIEIEFYVKNGNIIISLTNNTKICDFERKRIMNKLEKSENISDMALIYDNMDNNEGAGIGLITIMILLKKLGLNKNYIRFNFFNKYTNIKVSIPLDTQIIKEKIANDIVNEIEKIPKFPPHILKLEETLLKENAIFDDIKNIVIKDPFLITEILKFVNSSLIGLKNKVVDINNAIKILGFNGVKNLIFKISTMKLLKGKYGLEKVNKVIEVSCKVANYSYKLVKIMKFKEIIDIIYTACMLKDIGIIIIQNVNPKKLEIIQNISLIKTKNRLIFEKLSDGYNHSLIGKKLLEKWGFPEILIKSVEYHHDPFLLKSNKSNLFKIVSVIYLANLIYDYKHHKIKFKDIDYKILHYFKLINSKDLDELAEKLEKY